MRPPCFSPVGTLVVALLSVSAPSSVASYQDDRRDGPLIQGTVLEGCSCQIPCPCNFGQGARPHKFCAFLAFFTFDRGGFDGVSLAGHGFAVASNGENRTVIYIAPDETTSGKQALVQIARWIIGHEGLKDQSVLARRIRLDLLGHKSAGYVLGEETVVRTRPLVGNDGKSAIEVTNPWLFGSWPVARTQKGYSELVEVHSVEMSFRYIDTNANRATFEFLASSVTR